MASLELSMARSIATNSVDSQQIIFNLQLQGFVSVRVASQSNPTASTTRRISVVSRPARGTIAAMPFDSQIHSIYRSNSAAPEQCSHLQVSQTTFISLHIDLRLMRSVRLYVRTSARAQSAMHQHRFAGSCSRCMNALLAFHPIAAALAPWL